MPGTTAVQSDSRQVGENSVMRVKWSLLAFCGLALSGLMVGAIPPAAAAPAKKPATKSTPAKPKSISTKSKSVPEAVAVEPARVPGAFMVPKAVTLRPMTPAEAEANAVWNMRAALNVAALQCQFSDFLKTVKIYNAMLKHHSDELANAQTVMTAHFRRYDGAAKAVNSFDQYTTRTYNSYSTLDAQYAFCAAAGRVGRDVLATPRGGLGKLALQRNADIRAALGNLPLSPSLLVTPTAPIDVPPIVIADN